MNARSDTPMPIADARRQIVETFNAYFDAFAVRIAAEGVVVDTRRTLRQDGWAITYRVDDDAAGRPTLEFYATHRMTNDRHAVIAADGALEHLDAIDELLVISGPDSVEKFHSHNDAIEERLRSRGLYPHGQTGR